MPGLLVPPSAEPVQRREVRWNIPVDVWPGQDPGPFATAIDRAMQANVDELAELWNVEVLRFKLEPCAPGMPWAWCQVVMGMRPPCGPHPEELRAQATEALAAKSWAKWEAAIADEAQRRSDAGEVDE